MTNATLTTAYDRLNAFFLYVTQQQKIMKAEQ